MLCFVKYFSNNKYFEVVVHGAVGNRVATFALMLLGIQTDIINTVSLSNHPKYPNGFKGTSYKGDELLSLFEGLKNNGILKDYTHVSLSILYIYPSLMVV